MFTGLLQNVFVLNRACTERFFKELSSIYEQRKRVTNISRGEHKYQTGSLKGQWSAFMNSIKIHVAFSREIAMQEITMCVQGFGIC